MSRQILSVEIRKDALAAVLLNVGIKSSLIQDCALIPFDPASDQSGSFKTALQQLTQRMNIATASVVVSLPADQLIFRTLALPFSDEKKVRQVLPFELEPILPVAVEDLIIDFAPGSSGQETVFVTVAMERSGLQVFMESLQEVAIKPQLVVPGAFALALSLPLSHDLPEQAAMIDLGINSSTLFLFENRHLVLVRNINHEAASPDGLENLALKIRQTFTSHGDTRADSWKPEITLLCGTGVEAFRAGEGRLETDLKSPVRITDLQASLPRVDRAEAVKLWRPAIMDNALALALLEAEGRPCPNFHRSSSPLRNYWTTYRSFVRAPAILTGVVLLLALGSTVLQGYLLQKQVDRIDRQISQIFQATLPNTRRVGDPVDQIKSEIKKMKEGAVDPSFNAGKMRNIDLLYHISRLIPKDIDVVFDRLVTGPDSVSISGETASFKIVDDIKVRLEQSNLFSKVTIASANMEKTGNKINFKLTIEI